MYGHIDNITEIVIIAIFLMLATLAKMLFNVLSSLIIAPMFKLKCSQISLFGLMFTNQNGKWSAKFGKLSMLCQTNVIIDKDKADFSKADKMDKCYLIVRTAILIAIGIILVILNFPSITRFINYKASAADLMLTAFSVGLLIESLVSAGILIYIYAVMMKRLGGYVQFLINRLRAGDAFYMMNLKPVHELGFKNPSKTEKMLYYSIYMSYLLSLERVDEMRQPTYEMTDNLLNSEYIVQDTLNYYWLIFYYSRFEINPMIADKLVDKIWSVLSTDKDSNGKRVLAYYYYGIKGDSQTAKKYIDEGLAVLDKVSCSQAERELERKLLLELDKIIMYEKMNHEMIR